jgi:MinD-like ATPase involved in chromosome partitioning or flagellar assembly
MSSTFTITPAPKSFTGFLVGDHDPQTVINSTDRENFTCVFSDIEIFQQKESKVRSKLTQHGEGRILAKLFEFARYCRTQKYDFLIFDCMPGITYRSLDALVVSDKIMVVTRPVKSEISGLRLVISECYSKLEGAKLFSIMNQVENVDDLVQPPNILDVNLAKVNVLGIVKCLEESSVSIPLLHSFPRIPFVTERIYVLDEKDHPFTGEIKNFCTNLIQK